MSHSIEYFVEIEDEDLLKGPFDTLLHAINILKKISKDRFYSDEQARRFFLYGSAVLKSEILNDHVDCIKIGWLAREQAGILESYPEQFIRKRDRFAMAKEQMLPLLVESSSSVPD